MIDDRQARSYGVILDMFWRSVFSLAVVLAFGAITLKMITDPSWPMAAAEGFLSGTMYVTFRYYFPARKEKEVEIAGG